MKVLDFQGIFSITSRLNPDDIGNLWVLSWRRLYAEQEHLSPQQENSHTSCGNAMVTSGPKFIHSRATYSVCMKVELQSVGSDQSRGSSCDEQPKLSYRIVSYRIVATVSASLARSSQTIETPGWFRACVFHAVFTRGNRSTNDMGRFWVHHVFSRVHLAADEVRNAFREFASLENQATQEMTYRGIIAEASREYSTVLLQVSVSSEAKHTVCSC